MRSVRFDADLDHRVERAAEETGVTVSEFIRTAVRTACDARRTQEKPNEDWKAILEGSPYGDEWIRLLDGLVGSVQGDGMSHEDAMDDWARVIREHNFRD